MSGNRVCFSERQDGEISVGTAESRHSLQARDKLWLFQQSGHSEPSSLLSDIQFLTVGAVKLMARTVIAPVDPPLMDPEVTPALVRLADRGRDGRAPQPV